MFLIIALALIIALFLGALQPEGAEAPAVTLIWEG
jgi:hypothetical protein